MRTIGVTGGVGAGKSTVLDFLEERYGAYIIKADLVGHEVMEPGQRCYDDVVKLFGVKVIKEDKTIDRKRVSDVVFGEADKREALNRIIHPAVRQEILARLAREKSKGTALCIVEAALLLEEQYQDFCDEVWYIYADPETRIQRLMRDRGYTREKSENILKSQASGEFFRSHADFVVDNGHSVEETYRQITGRLDKNEIM